MQNLVGFGAVAVVSIIFNANVNVLRVWRENAYSVFMPLLGGFRGFHP